VATPELLYLIDSPLSTSSTEAQILDWLAELKKLPQRDAGVKLAVRQARHLLALVRTPA
jgi:hypothetical protein